MSRLDTIESELEAVRDDLDTIDRTKQEWLQAVDNATHELMMALDDKFHPGVDLKGFYEGIGEALSEAVYDLERPLLDEHYLLECALSDAEESDLRSDYYHAVMPRSAAE